MSPLLKPALLLCLLLALAACGTSNADVDAPPPSFVLVSVDTLRADHLSAWGYARDATPQLDALARRGLVFEQAVTTSENTLVSHASLFTGLFAGAHGATHKDGGRPLPAACATLAEDLLDAGWQTAGFAAHGDWLVPRYGMDQGFEVFTGAYRDADAVLAEASAWWQARDQQRPAFLFIHLFDVHSDRGPRPYEAPEPFRGRWTADYRGPLRDLSRRKLQGSTLLRAVMDEDISLAAKDLTHLVDQYDEGLAYTDNRLGSFLAGLDDPNTWIAVTSDHGEEFLEHGRTLHASFYDEVIRVPLLLVPPASDPSALGAPRRLSAQVRIVDLRPTLLSLAGLPEPTHCQGTDLLPWLTGDAPDCPAGPATCYAAAARFDGFKLVRDRGGPYLFDLAADPLERKDLSTDPTHAARLADLTALLDATAARDAALNAQLAAGESTDIGPVDAIELQRLEQLGYVQR